MQRATTRGQQQLPPFSLSVREEPQPLAKWRWQPTCLLTGDHTPAVAWLPPATWPVISYLKLLAVLLKNYSYALWHLVYLCDDSPWQGLLFIIHIDPPAVHLLPCNDYTFPDKETSFLSLTFRLTLCGTSVQLCVNVHILTVKYFK